MSGIEQVKANNAMQNINFDKFSEQKVSDKFDKFAKDKGIKLKLPSGKVIGSPVDGAKAIDIAQLVKILYGADNKSEMSHESIALKPEDAKELQQMLEDNKIVVKKPGIANSARKIADKLAQNLENKESGPVLMDSRSVGIDNGPAEMVIAAYNRFNNLIIEMMQKLREIEEDSNKKAEAQDLIAKASKQMEQATELVKQGLGVDEIGQITQLNKSAETFIQQAQAIYAGLV